DLCRVFHPLPVTAGRLADHLEIQARGKVAKGEGIGLHRPAVRVDAPCSAGYGAPLGVVPDDVEDRQVVLARYPVARGRHAEHVGAIAQTRHDRAVTVGKFGSEGGAEAPTENANGGGAEIGARLRELELRRVEP